jgi:diguanylate cyclase (GGDEF)-like protein
VNRSQGSVAGSLRAAVSALGITVALTIALAFPAAFGIHYYFDEVENLSFKARLNAEGLGRYIYSRGALWQYQQLRLAEIIRLPEEEHAPLRQRILDAQGKLILEEGQASSGWLIRRSAPIMVMGSSVGSIEIAVGVTPLLINTSVTALFSFALAYVAYFAVRLFPFRLLDHTVGELELQNMRFNAAMNNMIHGLTMFDGQQRLVVSNRRYRELYSVPEELTRPGTTLEALVSFRAANEAPEGTSVEDYKHRMLTFSLEDKSHTSVFELRNGRVITQRRNAMPGGGWVSIHEDVTEQRQAAARIAYLAHHDALTGLPNRVMLRERLSEMLGDVASGEALAVLGLDLDNFKEINDMLGHPFGDALLRQVADRLRAATSSSDVVARMGGDEFTIVQSGGAQPEAATSLATRLIEKLSAPYELDGHHVRVGTSVGVALAPADGVDADQLLKSADLALYRAKAEGRGVCRFFEAEMNEKMQARRQLEIDLRKALPNGEFELYYQPLLNLKSNSVEGFEALLRWNHPQRGRISPAEFIPLAEEIGMITPIGEWVLRQACAEAVNLPEHIKVAVNLSPAQFTTRNLVASVFNALAAAGLPASRLELEITESVLLEDTDLALTVLHQLRALGVLIAMDDFGTGYSSLSYLQKFPFDKIKVDRSFIMDLNENSGSMAVLRAVASLGASLGVTTTAEGVETEAQLVAVRGEGISQIQGYLVSVPKPMHEIIKIYGRPPVESREGGAAA